MKQGKDYIGVAAGALVFNNEGKVLLAKRGKGVRNESGKWEFTGGAVNFNETRKKAAVREIREEHDIEIDILDILGTIDHIIPDENCNLKCN